MNIMDQENLDVTSQIQKLQIILRERFNRRTLGVTLDLDAHEQDGSLRFFVMDTKNGDGMPEDGVITFAQEEAEKIFSGQKPLVLGRATPRYHMY